MGEAVRTAIEDQLTAITELRTALTAITVSASNADKSVTVQIDANGRLAGLDLTADAVARGHEELAWEIMHVLYAGQWQMTAQVEQVVQEALSEESEFARTVRRAFDATDSRPF